MSNFLSISQMPFLLLSQQPHSFRHYASHPDHLLTYPTLSANVNYPPNGINFPSSLLPSSSADFLCCRQNASNGRPGVPTLNWIKTTTRPKSNDLAHNFFDSDDLAKVCTEEPPLRNSQSPSSSAASCARVYKGIPWAQEDIHLRIILYRLLSREEERPTRSTVNDDDDNDCNEQLLLRSCASRPGRSFVTLLLLLAAWPSLRREVVGIRFFSFPPRFFYLKGPPPCPPRPVP